MEQLPAQLLRFAEERGLNGELAKLLDLVSAGGAGVLLVGSVAEGRYTSASDLDLLVLLRNERPRTNLLQGEVPHPTALGSESLGFISNVEVNLEYVEHRHAEHLEAMMRQYADALDIDAESLVLPVPDLRDLRLLNRLCNGLVINGRAEVHEWRRQVRTDLVPGFIGVLYFVTALDYMEDAIGWCDRDPSTATLMGREAAMSATMAHLAFHGRTHHDVKWCSYELADLNADARVDECLRRTWFPVPEAFDGPEYVAVVQDACSLVLDDARGRPALADHLRLMARYCEGRYRYGLADFVSIA